MRSIHIDINSKSTAIKRFERENNRKSTIIERQRILLEWYGIYFKF